MDAKTPLGTEDLADTLRRIAEALERLSPRPPAAPDLGAADAFVWHPDGRRLAPGPQGQSRRHGPAARASTGCATC